jgi:hypothetical protein
MSLSSRLVVILLGLMLIQLGTSAQNASVASKPMGVPTTDWRRHNVGKIGMVVSNIGKIGGDGSYTIRDKYGNDVIGLEYPIGSNVVFLSGCGLWVSAVVGTDTLTTTSYEPSNEWFPTDNPKDTILTKSNLRSNPYYDSTAISEQDFTATYQDDFWPVANHSPLHLKVIQKSLAWSISYLSDFIFFQYYIINKNSKRLDDVYVAYWVDADVGYYAPGFTPSPADGDIARFDKGRMMAVMLDADGDNGRSAGRIGMRIMKTPQVPNLKTTFGWYPATGPNVRLPWSGASNPDVAIHGVLTRGEVMPNQLPSESSDTRFLMGFGPFTVQPGDTLNFVMAIVAGQDDARIAQNADRAKELFDLNYVPPYVPPPSPALKVTPMSGKVKLNWSWQSGDLGGNPEDFIDPKTKVKDFEGYRLYKGAADPLNPSREPQNYVLIGQYDVVDGIGYDTGLNYEYEDLGLLNGVPYYYAVTSYDIGDTVNNVESLESNIRQNLVVAFPGKAPSTSRQLNVAVVPNPYIGSENYTQPVRWEDFAGKGWIEQDRRIQFINLPPRCTIRIYTLDGDLVKVIEHSDPAKGYTDWNLVSDANQAIASDIYLFSIEWEYGSQVGKFVVIK